MPRLKLDTSINRHAFDSFSPIHFSSSRGPRKKYGYKLLADRFFRKTGNNSQPVAHTLYRLPTRQRERERKGGMEGERERGRRRDGEGKRDREEKGKKKGVGA